MFNVSGEIFPGLGVAINLKRHIGFHLTLTYIPSIIFVLVAWLSFLVPSDIVPGRMVLCVTTLLTLTSMFNSVRYVYQLQFGNINITLVLFPWVYFNHIFGFQIPNSSSILYESNRLLGICVHAFCIFEPGRIRIDSASHKS